MSVNEEDSPASDGQSTAGRFARLSKAAVFDPRLSPPVLRTLAALATYADDQGHCFPAAATIARRLDVDPRTVYRHLNDLEAYGYVQRERHLRSRGGYGPNSYTLPYPELQVSQRSGGARVETERPYPNSLKGRNRLSERPKSNENDATPNVIAPEDPTLENRSEPGERYDNACRADMTSGVSDDATSGVALTIPVELSQENEPKGFRFAEDKLSQIQDPHNAIRTALGGPLYEQAIELNLSTWEKAEEAECRQSGAGASVIRSALEQLGHDG
jgi:DNA-binding transcriptional ArsR family regulator